MECSSARQRTKPRRTRPGCVHCLVSTVLVLSSVVSLDSPDPTWAAVYQCLDAAGKTVLTNRPSELHNCQVLSEGTDSAPTPPAPNTTPQVSTPPISSDIPPAPPYAPPNAPPMPPNRPADTQGASVGSLPAPNPGVSSSLSSPQPCSRGLNPLNPLSTPPCARSDQSGAKPPDAAPASPQ
jgi:hypothetical protein